MHSTSSGKQKNGYPYFINCLQFDVLLHCSERDLEIRAETTVVRAMSKPIIAASGLLRNI